MTDARLRGFWHRTGPLSALFATTVVAVVAAQGCGDGGTGTSSSGDTSSSSSGSGGNTSSSSSGGGSSGLTLNPAADAPIALDATPDPDGLQIYFTAIGANGPGVFTAPADGSKPTPTELFAGDPFAAPFGITISSDGKQLFVADPGADLQTDPALGDKGTIFVLPVGGGTPTGLPGAENSVPRGIDIGQENGKDVIFFTGTDPANGMPGVFKIPLTGGALTVVAEGAPFSDPSGIAVATNGDVYVADTIAAASRTASIIKISGGVATTLVPELRVGYPAGVALTMNEKQLYVSALDPDTLTDAIAFVDIAQPQMTSLFSTGINTYSESAGLHRSRKVDVFAWADSSAGLMGGKVFVVK